jgi:glutamate/aspartate transport system substrate-binding protein
MRRRLSILLTALAGVLVGLASIVDTRAADAPPPGSRLERIINNKSVRIAYRADATPFSFLSETKEPIGYTVELCKLVVKALAKDIGVDTLQIQWVPVTTQTRFDAVAKGQAEMECGSSTVTLSRQKQVDFSSYVFVETTAVAVKAASSIRSVADLAGKPLAVIEGTTNQRALEEAVREGRLSATLVAVKNREEGVAMLEGGKVDGFASDRLLLAAAPFKDPKAHTMLPEDLSFEPYAIVLPRGDWALKLAVDAALARIYRSGQVVQVFDQWFGMLGLRPGALLKAMFMLGAVPE